MIPYIIAAVAVGFWIGWAAKDYKWRSASRKDEFMVVDGKLYTVKEHINEHLGGN
jgi:hypothetical protein